MVSSGIVTVNNPSTATCVVGGNSYPITVSVDEAPLYDITVALEVISLAEDAADDAVEPSLGLTPPELAVTLDKDNGDALLVVACSDTMAAS